MAYTGTNPVTSGDFTKKSHYDTLLDNSVFLKDAIDNSVNLEWSCDWDDETRGTIEISINNSLDYSLKIPALFMHSTSPVSVAATTDRLICKVTVTVPAGQTLRLNTERYYINNANFAVRVFHSSSGTAKWTSTDNQGEETDTTVLYDNSAGGSPVSGQVEIYFRNTAGTSHNLQNGDYAEINVICS